MNKVGFLISDTGGGHRAAARAIAAALELQYPREFSFDYIDVFREYTPPPWRYAPQIYPRWIRYSPRSYGVILWWGGDVLMRGPLRRDMPLRVMRARFRRLLDEHTPDIIVVLHGAFPRFVAAARDALKVEVPIITVVTDLAKPHLGWYDPRVDRCLVPCAPAYARGLAAGVPPEKLRIVGHPAHPKFMLYTADKRTARRTLGWNEEIPTVLLLGGGDGMGEIKEIAQAIDAARPEVHLVIICGRNHALQTRLSARVWHVATDVYGFIDNMEVMMRAADLLITKAGPGTIAEAAISGIPMIIYGAIPLQETPNAHYVVKNGAGLYSRRPTEIARLVQKLLSDKNAGMLSRLAAGARRIAQPNAAFAIAEEIAQLTTSRVKASGFQPNRPAR